MTGTTRWSRLMGPCGMETSLVPRRTNHLLHLILTVFTCGAWGLVWPFVWLYNKMTHDRVRTYHSPTYPTGQYPPPPVPPQGTYPPYTGPHGQ